MKNIVVYFLLLAALPHPASSQFNIRNGAQVTTTGAASLELENMNLVNNGPDKNQFVITSNFAI